MGQPKIRRMIGVSWRSFEVYIQRRWRRLVCVYIIIWVKILFGLFNRQFLKLMGWILVYYCAHVLNTCTQRLETKIVGWHKFGSKIVMLFEGG